MTSTDNGNWSDRTDVPSEPSTTGLGATHPRERPSEMISSSRTQMFSERLSKQGMCEVVNNFLIKLQVPLFKIPASEKELDRIILRAKTKVVEPAAKNHEEKPLPVAPSTPSPSPCSVKKKRGKRRVDEQGFIPPKQLVRKKHTTTALPSTSTAPSVESEVLESAPPSISTALAAEGEGMEVVSDDPPTGDSVKDASVPEKKAPPPLLH
ncbi:hypothetical protein TNCT_515981 [Trichonephila clavata]|uniref:Uncharacterized protein n=1 Tax=Trichonephila clavata TaxID=2740835 RepID=A0A8X6FVR0_TRICU|nr:hypothetical protein TNCT_515981 [Trichonephila clavata]